MLTRYSDPAQRFRRRFRPILELLEDRLLPTTSYTVTSAADSGPGTLRDAINYANSQQTTTTIDFVIVGTGVHTIQLLSPFPYAFYPLIIDGYSQSGASPNTLATGDNAVLKIDIDGALAGSGASAFLLGSGNTTIKGLAITHFSAYAIFVQSNNNTIEGNFLGTDPTGTVAEGNGFGGIAMGYGSTGNLIGTNGDGVSDYAERNLISANGTGIILFSTNTTGNVVAGNYIGTDATGTLPLGNSQYGMSLESVVNNRIGVQATDADPTAEPNVVSGNPYGGFYIGLTGCANNVVTGNYIGTDGTGTKPVGNGIGILLLQGATSTRIGGSAALGNVIAFNGTVGIAVTDPMTLGNSIRANSIFGNSGLGIDLNYDGVTPNHLNNADTGPNDLQNFPLIKTATPGASTAVSGSFNSLPNTTFTVDFYANPTRDPNFYGQGQIYLGSTSVTTDANGNTPFAVTIPAATSAGEWITATATDPSGNTSEFCAAFPLPGNQTLNPVSWQSIGPSPVMYGPNTGRVTALAPNPTNANIMYAGSENGGIWETTDWQDPSPAWVPLTDNQPSPAIGEHALAVAHSNPSVIYAAASSPSGGILKSTNGGASWSFLGSTVFGNDGFGALVIDPTNANVVYVAVNAGTTGGVYKSSDGGQTWSLKTFSIGGLADDLVLDVNNPLTLYAGFTSAVNGSNGIWKTTDGGTSWQHMSFGITDQPAYGYIRLALSPSNSSYIYATLLDAGGQSLSLKRYGSTNGAGSWTALSDLKTSEGWRIVLGVDPSNPLIVYANGDHNLYQSTDGGNNWNYIMFVDPQGVYFDDAGAMTLGHDNGVYRFPTGILPYQIKTGDLSVNEFFNIALDPTNANAAYGVVLDYPQIVKYAGSQIWTIQSSAAIESEFGKMLVDPAQPNTVYYFSFAYPPNTFSFLRSDDAGLTTNPQNTGLDTTQLNSQTALAEDPNNPARLLLGTTVVYETTNRGNLWMALPSSPAQGAGVYVTQLAIGNGSLIYASTSDGRLFTSANDGTTWTEQDHSLPATGVSAIQIDPANDQEAIVTLGGSYYGFAGGSDVWMTTTGGASWTRLTGDLPNYATTTLAVDWRFAEPVLYVGTTRGVYASTNLGMHWALFGHGLPITVVDQLVLEPGLDILAAGTFGRGTWEIQVPGPATHLSVSAPANSARGAAFTVTVTALDAAANPAIGYTGTIHFSSSDGLAMLPVDYTFTAADAGVHTFVNGVTLNTSGSQTITVGDKTNTVIHNGGTLHSGGQTITAINKTTISITGSATVVVTGAAASRFQWLALVVGYVGHGRDVDASAPVAFGNGAASVAGSYTSMALDQRPNTFGVTPVAVFARRSWSEPELGGLSVAVLDDFFSGEPRWWKGGWRGASRALPYQRSV
jgi:hypothetical protein